MRCWVGTSRTATVDKDDVSIFFFNSFFILFFEACAQGGSHAPAFFSLFYWLPPRCASEDSDVARPVQPDGKLHGQKARNKQNKLMGSLSV